MIGRPRTRRIALALWLLILVLSAVELAIILVTFDHPPTDQWGIRGFEGVLAVAYGSVGALIASRRPDNRIGWLLIGASVISAAQGVIDQYRALPSVVAGPLPLMGLANWTAAWIWVIPMASLLMGISLLFPDGRLVSARWRWAVVLCAGTVGLYVALTVAATQPLGPVIPSTTLTPYFQTTPWIAIGLVGLVLGAAVAASAAAVRFRRAVGDSRQQLKWLAAAAIFAVITAPLGFSTLFVGQLLFLAAALSAAVALAVAIFHYRLYEIDVIISRALVYGALTAIIAGVYTASITLTQRLFVAVTNERSDAAIVITTLIVVTTFTPLKTRVQGVVDRRVKPPKVPADASVKSSLEALEALGQLIQLNTTGGLTADEFTTKKAELLARV